jgi:hypothetical protein
VQAIQQEENPSSSMGFYMKEPSLEFLGMLYYPLIHLEEVLLYLKFHKLLDL